MYLGECPKINMAAISMEMKRGEKIIGFFPPYFFILIIINVQWYEWVEKWAKQFFDQIPMIVEIWNESKCTDTVQTCLKYECLCRVSVLGLVVLNTSEGMKFKTFQDYF